MSTVEHSVHRTHPDHDRTDNTAETANAVYTYHDQGVFCMHPLYVQDFLSSSYVSALL